MFVIMPAALAHCTTLSCGLGPALRFVFIRFTPRVVVEPHVTEEEMKLGSFR